MEKKFFGILVIEGQFPKVSRLNVRLFWLAKALKQKHCEAMFVCPADNPLASNSGSFEGIGFFQFPGFAKALYGNFRLFARLFNLASSVLAIVFLARKKRAAFLHAWNPVAGFSAAIASKIIRRPFFLDFTDFYSDIAKQEAPLLSGFFESIERFSLKNARAVFVVSNVMKQRLSKKGIAAEKIFVVADGTDTKTFSPRIDSRNIAKRFCLPENKTIVFHGGDIKHADGADILLKAFKIVLQMVPDAKLLIVGGTGKEIALLQSLAENLSVQESVVFTGLVPMKEVPAFLNAASVGAMPLRATLNHQCYLSFKIFEYWACGKPVVVSRLQAISEIARQNQNALLCEPANADCFAKSLAFLLNHPAVAKRLGNNGRKTVEKEFDWQKLMEKESGTVLSFLPHK